MDAVDLGCCVSHGTLYLKHRCSSLVAQPRNRPRFTSAVEPKRHTPKHGNIIRLLPVVRTETIQGTRVQPCRPRTQHIRNLAPTTVACKLPRSKWLASQDSFRPPRAYGRKPKRGQGLPDSPEIHRRSPFRALNDPAAAGQAKESFLMRLSNPTCRGSKKAKMPSSANVMFNIRFN